MTDLGELLKESVRKRFEFKAAVRAIAPHLDEFDWYRALTARDGGIGRHNDDKSYDDALTSSEEIRVAHDAYIKALHTFYRARDGEGGILGGRL